MNHTERSESRLKQFFYNYRFLILLIIIVGFFIRLSFAPLDIPLTEDALDYLAYSMAISNHGGLPVGNYPTNDGWPILLSWFFTVLPLEGFIQYSNFQIFLSMTLSTVSAIPIFLICKKFVEEKFALIGASIFIFHPFVIENSFSGLTEPFYILLLSISILFIINNRNRNFPIAFFLIGIASIVRYEAFLFIIPFSIIFFIVKKINKKSLIIFFISLLIFSSLVFCISSLRIESSGEDGLVSNVVSGPKFFYKFIFLGETKINEEGIPDDPIPSKYGEDFTNKTGAFISISITNFVLLLGKSLFPIMLCLVPFGIYYFMKNRDVNSWFLIIFSITASLPILFILGRDVLEIRYFLILFPLFSIISSYAIQKISTRIKSEKIFIISILIIVFSGIIVVNDNPINFEEEKESFEHAIVITSIANGVNYFSNSKYIEAADLNNNWPNIPEFNKSQNPNTKTAKFLINEYDSLEEFIFENMKDDLENNRNGLTHIIIDRHTQSQLLQDMEKNENDFTYLKKLEVDFPSNSQQLVIFEINFEKFEELINKKSFEFLN